MSRASFADARQGDMFALLDRPPPLFAKQLAADSPPARAMLADLQLSANAALADASRIDEAPWLEQPELLERVREINAVPTVAVAAMMGADFDEPGLKLLDQAIAATGKNAAFKVDVGLLARRIAASASLYSQAHGGAPIKIVYRVHVAEALSYLLEPRSIEPARPAPAPAPVDHPNTVFVEDAFFDGPVADSYSADKIGMEGTVRPTFRHGGSEWVNTGGLWAGSDRARDHCSCYRLVPDDGTAAPYAKHTWNREERREMGGYHGMAVKRRGEAMMLVGPETRFMRAPSLL